MQQLEEKQKARRSRSKDLGLTDADVKDLIARFDFKPLEITQLSFTTEE